MNLGIIGIGRIGMTLLEGLGPSDVYIYDMDTPKIKGLNAKIEKTPQDVAKKADIIFLSVDPPSAIRMIGEIKKELAGKTLISLCAYVAAKKIKEIAPEATVIRIIPNFAMSVNEGVIAYASDDAPVDVLNILKKLGKIVIVDEHQLDVMTGLFACSPAYISELINSLALLARKEGVEDELALELAVQTFFGPAKIEKQSVYSPSRLIDEIGASGGSTEEGLKVFRDKKVGELFASAVQKAILSAKEKTKKLA